MQTKLTQNQHQQEKGKKNEELTDCTIANIDLKTSAPRLNSYGFYESCVLDKSQDYFLLSKVTKPFEFKYTDDTDLVDFILKPPSLLYGVCAQAGCSKDSIRGLFGNIFDQKPETTKKLGRLRVVDLPDYLNRQRRQDSVAITYMAAVFLVFWFVAIGSQTYRVLRKKWRRKYYTDSAGTLSIEEIEVKVSKKLKNSFWRHFDLKTNFKKLITPRKQTDPLTQTFTLARSIGMLLVVLGHEFSERIELSDEYASSPKEALNFVRNNWGSTMAQMGFYAVSLFYIIGGFVSIISSQVFYEKAKKAGRSCCAIYFYMILKRYARFAPLLFLVVMYYSHILKYFGNNPTTALLNQKTRVNCPAWVVANELLLLFPSPGCATWVWYLQCDFNMYMILALIVLTTKSQKSRIIFISVVMIVSFVASAVVMVVIYRLFGILSNDLLYIQAFYRIRIYMFGALVGFHITNMMARSRRRTTMNGKVGEVAGIPVGLAAVGENYKKAEEGWEVSLREQHREVGERMGRKTDMTNDRRNIRGNFFRLSSLRGRFTYNENLEKFEDWLVLRAENPIPELFTESSRKSKGMERIWITEDVLGLVGGNGEEEKSNGGGSGKEMAKKEGSGNKFVAEAYMLTEDVEEGGDEELGLVAGGDDAGIEGEVEGEQGGSGSQDKAHKLVHGPEDQEPETGEEQVGEASSGSKKQVKSPSSNTLEHSGITPPTPEPKKSQKPEKSPKHKKKKRKLSPAKKQRQDLIVLSACVLILISMFIWYHIAFQAPHIEPTSPVLIEVAFYLFSAFLINVSFLGAIFKLVTWSKKLLNYFVNSRLVHGMANLSFSIYMSHFCVIFSNSSLQSRQYSFFFYDALGFFLTDMFYTIWVSFVLALFVEMPFSNLWKYYVDAWFLKIDYSKEADKGDDGEKAEKGKG